MNNKPTRKEDLDLKDLFNMNNILSQLLNFAAYIILVASAVILIYLSFVQTLKIVIDWVTLGVFAGATVLLSWINWNSFYRKQYEKLMADDIAQNEKGEYSIHGRYYNAIKDWTDDDLQKQIDKFNEEYIKKWLRYVEVVTGEDIETIKTLPYRKFKHKILMWRIKHHVYPKSGYKTSMELMSLFSFQDSNLNKRHLKGDKHFYIRHSIMKLIWSTLFTVIGASIIPEMIHGEIWEAVLKLMIALGSLIAAVIMGATNGIRGARMKLSTVEDACSDLEHWAGKKPLIAPYKETIRTDYIHQVNESLKEKEENEVTHEIFNKPNLPK